MNLSLWPVALLGLLVAGASLTPVIGRLKATQAAGVGVGIFFVALTLLPPGKLSIGAGSYEPLAEAKAAEVTTTARQFDALSRRVLALEQRVAVLASPKSTPAQKEAAAQTDQSAQRGYRAAKAAADRARQRYLSALQQRTPKKALPSAPCPLLTDDNGRTLTDDAGTLLCAN